MLNESATPLAEDGDSIRDEVDDPTTEGTVGYVEGYWYDETLPVDSRNDTVVREDELDALVYRSMARVELLRDLTFQDDVPVDVVSREEFQAANEGGDEETDAEGLEENLRFETLFLIDRESETDEEFATLLGDAVGGFYSPEQNRVVLVSDRPGAFDVDEDTLAHELLHALQDQHFDLQRYEKDTQNQAHAKDGLIEGDAVWIETEYENRCEEEWECVTSDEDGDDPPSGIHWGLYLVLFQPYSDGPSFVDHLLGENGWDAVNDAYENPPTTSSEIIHPETYGESESTDVSVTDRSTGRWQELETEGQSTRTEFGEATMAAMLAYPTLDEDLDESIVAGDDLLTGDDVDPLNYDHEYTNGWAGDTFVPYVTDGQTIDESGYVWQTEWESEADAVEFADGYLQLLAVHDAMAVEERQDTFVIETGFPGAYYLEHENETLTIVNAPSLAELEEIRDGAAPVGSDTIGFDGTETSSEGIDAETTEPVDELEDGDDRVPVSPGLLLAGMVLVALFAIARGR